MFANLSTKAKKRICLAISWLIIVVILLNPFGTKLFISISNQEIFSYHIRDLLGSAFSGSNGDEYYLATGSYEYSLYGEDFGVGKDKNLIVIQMEAFQNFMIGKKYNGQEITPVLNELIKKDSYYFDQYYQILGGGNTSDAEFATNNSLIGTIESYTYKLYEQNYYRGLPWILKDLGYSTAAFHGFDKTFWNREGAYPNQGFDQFINSDVLVNDNDPLPYMSDESLYEQAIPYLKEMSKPFYGFLVTLSGHHPFNLTGKEEVLQIAENDAGTNYANYLNAMAYTDKAIGDLIERLKAEGLYEDTIIAVYGDHFGLSKEDPIVKRRLESLIGHPYDFEDMFNIPLIIHVPGSGAEKTISVAGSQIDFMPTISYILGIEKLDTLYLGKNLINASNGFVPIQSYMLSGSFIDDEIVFEMSRDGVFENSRAWNKESNQEVDLTNYFNSYQQSLLFVEMSRWYLENNVIEKAFIDGLNIAQIKAGEAAEKIYPKIISEAESNINGLNEIYNNCTDETPFIKVKGSMTGGDDSISLWRLIHWLDAHKDTRVLLEGGEELIPMLTEIQGSYSDISDQVIPVMHSLAEYTLITNKGFKDVLFHVNVRDYTLSEIANFLKYNDIWAVALTEKEIKKNIYGLTKSGYKIYGVGIEESTLEELRSLEVDGLIVSGEEYKNW